LSESPYVGRGERLTKKILLKLIPCVGIESQVNIKKIVSKEDFDFMDQELKNHNFDFVLRRLHEKDIVIEVNYHHREKIAKKLRTIFVPMVIHANCEYIEINDWECNPRGLFWLNSKKEHPVTWLDYTDIINALQTCNIQPTLI